MSRLIMSLSALALLAGCGIPGGLERPDPLWNSDEAIARECERAAQNGEALHERCTEQEPQPPQ
ncbi:MAG: hypothetical protein NVV62_16145 [Terricaulis sp.]|nr:hypothetical protein [Terricaulis sp.]